MTHDDQPLGLPALDLTRLAPDTARAGAVRARCRARLERRGRWNDERVRALRRIGRVLAPAMAGALGVLYLASLLGYALGG